MSQEMKLKIKSFDHRILDKSVSDIVQAAKRAGVKVKGAIPMPRKIKRFTVNRSSHIDKESREQFEIRQHSRLLILLAPPQAMDSLMKLDLPSGVDFEIKSIKGDK
jgi:small subunit ribosomal protein S10